MAATKLTAIMPIAPSGSVVSAIATIAGIGMKTRQEAVATVGLKPVLLMPVAASLLAAPVPALLCWAR